MTDDPYTIIHTGDPYDFVIKNVNEPETYGTFHGDKYDQKSMKKFIEKVNSIVKENEQLKQFKEKVFVLLDEKIKHYEHKPFSAPVGQPMSVNFDADVDRLARLSELQDLEKELKMND